MNQATSKIRSLSPFSAISATILVLGVILVFGEVLIHLFQQLVADEDFSYGLLLPFVSGYLIYLKWPQIRQITWRPSWLGLGIIMSGFSLYLVGKLTATSYALRQSLIIVLGGLLQFLGGWRVLRLCWFPLFLLFFMIPLPSLLISKLTLPLQLISSRLAAEILGLLGIPLVIQGNIIDLGVRQLQVVAACSGLRYILSLLALGLVFCYFYQPKVWKAAILIIFLIPAAILANAIRVTGMGLYPSLQEGFWHSFTGWLIFLFCFGFLLSLNWLLNYLKPQTLESKTEGTQAGEGGTALPAPPYPVTPLVGAIAIIIMGGIFVHIMGTLPRIPLLKSLDQFPLKLGEWQGGRQYMDREIFLKTEADSYIDIEYINPYQEVVSLYIAHYETQSAFSGGMGHHPGACMTGAGWNLLESGKTEIAPGFPILYLITERGGNRLLVYYWHLQQGEWSAQDLMTLNKYYLIRNGLIHRRTDWALVRLVTQVGKDLAASRERLVSFGRLLIPVLPQFISCRYDADGR